MRINREANYGQVESPHAGELLLAHPHLLDPNFRRSVILLSAHSEKEGSIGVVVNRPMNQTLGQYDPELSDSPLSHVPLFVGGPVGAQQLILVAWKWSEEEGTFKLYFGIDGEKARRLQAEDSGYQLRGFLGHAGWSEGQLNAELEQGSWVLSGRLPVLKNEPGGIIWHDLLCHERPDLRLLVDAPDDPSLN
jgi:putative transcriptional regulator